MLDLIQENLDEDCSLTLSNLIAIDEEDLRNRIRAFELVHEHATAYFRHIGNNCASYTEGVRVFDN